MGGLWEGGWVGGTYQLVRKMSHLRSMSLSMAPKIQLGKGTPAVLF